MKNKGPILLSPKGCDTASHSRINVGAWPATADATSQRMWRSWANLGRVGLPPVALRIVSDYDEAECG